MEAVVMIVVVLFLMVIAGALRDSGNAFNKIYKDEWGEED